jgi:hypothetical protein
MEQKSKNRSCGQAKERDLKDKSAIAKHEILHISNNETRQNSLRSVEAAHSLRELRVVRVQKVTCMQLESEQNRGDALRTIKKSVSRGISLVAILFASWICSVNASAETLLSRYAVSLDGLHIGDAVLRTALEAKRYKVAVSADIGMLLASTQIQGVATGARAGAKLTPEHFQIVMTGGDQGTVEVNFATSAAAAENGAVRLKGVFDPLSALLAASLKPASPSNHPCNGVLPIFTGRERFDLKLRPKAPDRAQAARAFVICEATAGSPQPGGSGRPSLEWEIILQKVSKPHFWLVERISLPTQKGVVTIERAETSISGS